MGEIADDHVDRMLQEGYYPFARPRNKWNVTCNRCGMHGLKWRDLGTGHWKLYENVRVGHNQLKMHECNPSSEDDFDVVEPE